MRWCWLVQSSVSQSANPTQTMSLPAILWALIAPIMNESRRCPAWILRMRAWQQARREGDAEMSARTAALLFDAEMSRQRREAAAGGGGGWTEERRGGGRGGA